MKPRESLRRKTAKITKSRWKAYATAGAASAFGCAVSAEADITYSGLINHHFDAAPGMSSRAFFQLDRRGHSIILALSHQESSPIGGSSGNARFFVDAFSGAVAGFRNSRVYASRLSFGQNINARPFVSRSGIGYGILALSYTDSARESYGQWLQPGIGFLGFRFNGGAGLQYGWARINMDGQPENSFTLIDYAFGDAGDRITAGQTSVSNVPDSAGSLGLLAIGCAGLLAWRARRGAADSVAE